MIEEASLPSLLRLGLMGHIQALDSYAPLSLLNTFGPFLLVCHQPDSAILTVSCESLVSSHGYDFTFSAYPQST